MAREVLVSAAQSAVTLRLTALRQMVEQEGLHGAVALWPEQVTATPRDLVAVERAALPAVDLVALTGAVAALLAATEPVTVWQALAAEAAAKKVMTAVTVMAVVATLPAVMAEKVALLTGMAPT